MTLLTDVLASGRTQIHTNILNDEPWYKHDTGAVIGGGFGIYNIWGGAWLYSMQIK